MNKKPGLSSPGSPASARWLEHPTYRLGAGLSPKKARKGGRFRAPIFVVTHFVTQLFVTVELEANEPDEKTLF